MSITRSPAKTSPVLQCTHRGEKKEENLNFQEEIRKEVRKEMTEQTKKMAEAQNKKMAEIKEEVRDECSASLEATIMKLFTRAFQQNIIGSGNTKRQLLKEFPETQQITASPGVSSPQYKKPKQKDAEDETMREANNSDRDELEAVPTPPPTKDSQANSAGRRRLHLIDSRISFFRIAPPQGIQ
jgi:ABC-type Fe3+-citrate transport system substrate-binding protein